MYGTVARLHFKPGIDEQREAELDAASQRRIPGAVASYVYRTDADPNVYYLAVVFASKAAYDANAASPEQHAEFLRLRALLAEDPEWHDGAVVRSMV